MLLCALLALASTAKATDFTQIYADVQFGNDEKTYAYTYWYYVADQTRTLTMKSLNSKMGSTLPRPYSDEDCTNQITHTVSSINGVYQYDLDVEEGTTYYFKLNYTWYDSVYYILASTDEETALELSYTSPTEGDTLSFSGSGNIAIYCNMPFTCNSTATLKGGGQSADLEVNIVTSRASATASYSSTLISWLQDGYVKEGDDVTITFTEIAASSNSENILGEDGTLTLTYKAPAVPTQLVEEILPETFLSYWLPTDEDGLLKLVFDADIASGSARFTYGDTESENDYYIEEFEATVDGCTLTVDFTDKLRTPSTMLESGTVYSDVYIKVYNVIDANGNSAYSSGSGTVGSYSYTIDYKDISQDVATEWTPKSGSDISETESIELYISNASLPVYTGVQIDYVDSSSLSEAQTILSEEEYTTKTEDGGLTLTIPVGESLQTGYNVTVTLADLQFVDGIYTDARTAYFTATYNSISDEALDSLRSAQAEENGFTRIYTDSIFGVSPNKTTTYWYYIAEATQTLTMIAQQINTGTYIPRPYSDIDCTEAISFSSGYSGGYYQYKLKVTEGETYYFKLMASYADSAYYMLASEATISSSLELLSTSPEEGDTLSFTGTGNVSIYFNQAITCDATATMASGNLSAELDVNIVSTTSSAVVSFTSQLAEWLQAGSVKEGDVVTFTFTGIAATANPDSILGEDGSLTLSYYSPANPVQLVSSVVPETFLSYWLPDDEDGVVTLTFSGELSSASAYMTYGDRDTEGDYYYEELPVEIDSDKVIVDLTDVLRTPSTMTASGTLYESVYLKVSSVRDINGNSTYSTDQGSVGSYSFNFDYEDISQNIATEWTPTDGKDIENVSEVELYISVADVAIYSGVTITYIDPASYDTITVTIDADELTIEEEDGGEVITFTLPEGVNTGYNVTITLSDLQFIDGIYTDDRTDSFTVTYNPVDDDTATAISAVATTGTLSGEQDIYTLSGQLVRKNASTLDGLSKGVYIVGGAKVLVK